MIAGWLLLLVSLGYVAALFALAYYGDRRPLYPSRTWLRPLVYSLALAVYCSSWTFYGAVGTAAGSSLSYLPIYLGPILLFAFGSSLFHRLTVVAKQRNITSIADFIASRFGKSHGLAALVTIIAVTAAIPYIALQFKAVATSIEVLSGAGTQGMPLYRDSALYIAALLAMFAILFGTRRIDATEHHHGMMLAIAVESLIKLIAFVAIGLYALQTSGFTGAIATPVREFTERGLPPGFVAQTLLAFVAMFCLPRQFQVGVIECEDPADVRQARRLFPAYLLLIIVFVLPIVAAGAPVALARGIDPDAYVLGLPLAGGHNLLALFAYIGGFSAATGMVIVECVALSTMISNDLVVPALLRIRRLGLERRADVSGIVLTVRRIAIVVLAALAYAYYRATTRNVQLASIGLLAFVALAQFAPAIVSGLYWRNVSRIGVTAGLIAGFAVWLYTLLLPSMAENGWLPSAWVQTGAFGIAALRPHALLYSTGWDAVTHGTFWSLFANVGCVVVLSLRYRPGVDERLRAAAFLDLDADRINAAGDWRGRVPVGDLRALAERIVGEKNAHRAFDDYAQAANQVLLPNAAADRALVQFTERLLAGAIGAASARRMLTSALRGTGLDLSEAVTMLDEASQELRFSRELIGVTFQNMTQGISVVDSGLRIVAWNRRYSDLFDYPEGFVYVGRPVMDLIRYNAQRGLLGPGDIEELVRRRLDFLGRGTQHVFVRERPDGRVIETRGEPLPGGGYLTTFSDITDYKRAELALREANETLEQRVAQRTQELREALSSQEQAKRQAEAANASKTRFLAAASHDLLQPLNAARLFTSALRHQPHLDADSAQLAERIDASFKAAEDLLDALLEASRLDAGRHRPEISVFPLGEIFESIQHQFSVLAATRGLRLHVVPTRVCVRSDPHLLRRIVQNFLSNALRYTRKGGVLLGVRRHGNTVSIEVRDTGPGIASEHLRLIFDEFRRLEHPSPWGEKGLGLGLAICDRIARMLGHELKADSRPGQGSWFSIRVPRAAATAASPTRILRRASPVGLPSSLHVLCLDNDSAILEGMLALLTRWGVSCDIARNVEEAQNAASVRRPDLILADYHLDDPIDGLAALDRIREAFDPPPPGALITADASLELKVSARERGYALLRKPVKPAALRALIAQLGRSRQGVQPAATA
ncbi:MAG TPA: PAS domain-containing hybrid sensor histidine kinase/response regulator [Rudaea sp.]|nr:PAS domain-containing hybrid sensor histidine kinase/response regulator [Rudaea sp.]